LRPAGGSEVGFKNFTIELEHPDATSRYQLPRVGNATDALVSFRIPAKTITKLRPTQTAPARLLIRSRANAAVIGTYELYKVAQTGTEAARVAGGETGTEDTDGAPSSPTLFDCAQAELPPNSLYDRKGNQALFVVTTTGNVLYRPTEPIDEDDKVLVKVIGLSSDLQTLQVHRSSAIRQTGTYYIMGNAESAAANANSREPPAQRCASITVPLADFAPGKGEVELVQTQADGKKATLGTFDFTVNRLYRGAFSFGPVYSWLTDRSFGTVRSGNDTVVTITEQSPRLRYMVAYTHYFRKVDAEKQSRLGLLAPTIGLSLTNPLKNLFLGLTYDIAGSNIYVTVGGHFSEITVIDPAAKLSVGSPLPRKLTTVPTRTQLGADWFVSASIDLRAAGRLFTALTSTATGAPR
jgi:hypothetical protein